MSRIAVAIVNYNTARDLRECLGSVYGAGADEVVVKDNGSTDGSVEMVRRDFPRTVVHPDFGNPGYGAASNQAIAACRAEYVLLLNSDTLLARDTLAVLNEYLAANPRVGLVGPRLHNVDGSLQRSAHGFPAPFTIRPVLRYIPVLRDRSLLTWPHDRTRPVPWVKGAALAIRRTAFDAVGGFDPSFFMYFEETDLCRRLWNAGWEVHFTTATTIVHKGGASTTQMRAAMALQFYVGMRQFYARHYSPSRQARLDAVLKATSAVLWVRDRARLAFARTPEASVRLGEELRNWSRIIRDDWPVRPARPSAGATAFTADGAGRPNPDTVASR